MTDLRQAAQQALEALESGLAFDTHSDVLQNLRTALEQQAEPVAWQVMVEDEAMKEFPIKDMAHDWCVRQKLSGSAYAYWIRPLYTAPPQQQAEPVAWDKPSASFNAWWDSYRHDPANPFAEGSAAYWAWAGWKSAQRQWVGLEAEDLAQIESDEFWQVGNHMAIAMAVEAKLKERNND